MFFFSFPFWNSKQESATMHFFPPPAQAQHASATHRCPFAYSLADSVQNNLGIVTDVIRRMIKQGSFLRRSLPHPLSWQSEFHQRRWQILNVYCKEWLAANEFFQAWAVTNLWVWFTSIGKIGRFCKDSGDGQNLQRSETERLMGPCVVRWNGKLILNSRELVIIREPQQPLLNYRSHQCDWMRLGHCNTILIIYRLYYYSNNCMVGVSVSLPSPFYFLVTKRTLSY